MKSYILFILIIIQNICLYISYIPQIIKLLKTKRSEDISLASWILWVVGSVSDVLYSVILLNIGLVIVSITEFIFIAIITILTIHYRSKLG